MRILSHFLFNIPFYHLKNLLYSLNQNFMHAIENKYAPSLFENTWQKNRDRDPEVNLRNADNYYIARPRI